ncbi:MAG: cytochrome c3 family protein [Coriobacteriales bacterium]|nr:cytochrome c3 family protein [Coriobacteriales bacterium]
MSDKSKTSGQSEIGGQEISEKVLIPQGHGPAEGSEPSNGQEPGTKKKMNTGLKIFLVTVITIVVIVGGVGGAYLGLHDKPGFCNFICHTPMDPYVVSYEEGTSVNPAQADSGALLSVTLHKNSDQKINCLTCHVPTMDEQIQEGVKWVTGNYELPIEMKVVAGQVKEGSGNKNGIEFCLRPECHEGVASLEDLKAVTADQHRNPHNSHLGNQDCANCHQTHEQSVMTCTQCHADAKVPEGWLTYKELQKQLPAK